MASRPLLSPREVPSLRLLHLGLVRVVVQQPLPEPPHRVEPGGLFFAELRELSAQKIRTAASTPSGTISERIVTAGRWHVTDGPGAEPERGCARRVGAPQRTAFVRSSGSITSPVLVALMNCRTPSPRGTALGALIPGKLDSRNASPPFITCGRRRPTGQRCN